MTRARTIRAAILGATGYGGGELLRLLAGHPSVEAVQAVSRSRGGQPLHAVHANLRGVVPGSFVAAPDWAWLAEAAHPVLFAAMPHGAFAAQVDAVEEALTAAGIAGRAIVVDLSGDFRLDDAGTFAAAYGGTHPSPAHLRRFVYGLPEWQRDRIRAARRVANPGCFATAIELALLPYAVEGLEGFVAVDAKTGSSGSGARAGDGTHHPVRSLDFRAYKVLEHQHEAEIDLALRGAGAGALELSFVPQSAPFARGIFATAHLRRAVATTEGAERERFVRFYDGHPFVRVVEGSPRVGAVRGSNFCDVGVAARGRTVVVMTAIDNLMKGMAGQAVQNMNLALGLDETEGLWFPGAWPP